MLAAAHYEAATIFWAQACDADYFPPEKDAVEAFRRAKMEETEAYLDKVAKWETFVLDGRIGLKVQTGLDTIQWIKKKKNWV